MEINIGVVSMAESEYLTVFVQKKVFITIQFMMKSNSYVPFLFH